MRRPSREGLRARPLLLAFAVALVVAMLLVADAVIEQAAEGPMRVAAAPEGQAAAIEPQQGQYRGLQPSLRPVPPAPGGETASEAPPPAAGRNLATVAERRAYPGAPPFIPHEIVAEMATGEVCLTCHRYGGWTPRFEAWAPTTPHPELIACQQCHVARKVEDSFRATDFRPLPAPPIDGAALPGSPPPVPHTLQMRADCLACHAGPSAPPEIRTTHPERVGCLQCHVPTAAGGTWERGFGIADAGPAPEGPG